VVYTGVKVARSFEMRLQICSRTAEHVSVVHKCSVKPAIGIFNEYCLPMIGVGGAYIYQPGQPEVGLIADPMESVLGKDLDEANVDAAEE
jgi:hypothetical protein